MGGCCAGRNESTSLNPNELQMRSNLVDNQNNMNCSMYTSNFFENSPGYFPKHLIYTEENDTSSWDSLQRTSMANSILRLSKIYIHRKILPITIEEIWNITKHYNNDFTSSKYILYDLREREQKTENFLKAYKCINYTIDNMNHFSKEKFTSLNKFLNNKQLIIIPKEENWDEVNRWIGWLEHNNVHTTSYWIISENFSEDTLPVYSLKLYKHIDHSYFQGYPFVLFPWSKLKYINNHNFIFLDINSNPSIFSFDNLSSSPLETESSCINKIQGVGAAAKSFINEFQVNLIINLKANTNKYMKEKYGEVNYWEVGTRINENPGNLRGFLNVVQGYILSLSSVLIIINAKTPALFEGLSLILSYILNKISYINTSVPNKNESLSSLCGSVNLVYLPENFTMTLKENLDKIDIELNEMKYKYLDTECMQHVETLVKSLFHEVNQNYTWLGNVLFIVERIIWNVWTHPKNVKYYKIRKDSKTFSENVERYSGAKKLLVFFGFKTDTFNSSIYYLDVNYNWIVLQEMYDFWKIYIKNNIK